MKASDCSIRSWPAMGSVASLHLYAAATGEVVDAVVAELGRLEQVFSTFRRGSVISAVNRGELHPLDAGDEVVAVLDAVTWLDHASGGAFCSYRPDGSLDPAGFVKGWAVQRAARLLDDAGFQHWYLGVGGDIQTRGSRPDGSPWRVAIADPLRPGHVVAQLDVVDAGVATSGTAERGDHLWTAAGRYWASVTVTGPDLTWADAFATTGFALGPAGLDWIAQFDGYAALGVTTEGALRSSGEFRQ